MPAVTIIDVARALGISKTTVADALGGSGRVSEATRARVLETAQAMGYVSNRAARSLRRRSTGACGLYIPSEVRGLSFYMHFAFGVADGLADTGFDLTLHTRTSRHFQVDGVIVIDAMDDDIVVDRMLDTAVPVISAGRMSTTSHPEGVLATIEIDHAAIATHVLDRLNDKGTIRPGYLGLQSQHGPTWAEDSLRGYRQWCTRHRIDPAVETLPQDPSEAELLDAVDRLISSPGIDAIVCGPQGLAGRALPILHSLGKTVAETDRPGFHLASLAGDPIGELGSSRILAIDLQPRQFGRSAAEFLVTAVTTPPDIQLHKYHQPDLDKTTASPTR